MYYQFPHFSTLEKIPLRFFVDEILMNLFCSTKLQPTISIKTSFTFWFIDSCSEIPISKSL